MISRSKKLFKIIIDFIWLYYSRNIEEERESLIQNRIESRIVNTYARFNNIIAWMNDLTNSNPSFISQYTPGRSFQNRDIRVLVIRVGEPPKRVWIDCGIHAREW
jgi:hypothetical protein